MKKPPMQRRQIFLWILSLLIVASMVCSFVVMLQPPRSAPEPTLPPARPQPTRTSVPRPTTAPTSLALTLAPPTRQPEATASLPPTPTPSPQATAQITPSKAAMLGAQNSTFVVLYRISRRYRVRV